MSDPGNDTLGGNRPGISEDAHDALVEFVNVGVGHAANALSELTSKAVTISVPKVELISLELAKLIDGLQFGGNTVLRVSQGFSGGMLGTAMLVINEEGSRRLAELLLGEGETLNTLDQNAQAALLELGNIVMNGIVGTLVNALGISVTYEIPALQLRGVGKLVDLISDLIEPKEAYLLLMRASIGLSSNEVSGYLMLILHEDGVADLISRLEKVALGA